jgi:predicted secreted protein
MPKDVIAVGVDEEFTISLQSIATAGYLWQVESLPNGVELLGAENENPAGETKPGDPTTRVFRFRARKAGEYEVTFELARPWENKAIATKSITARAT